MKKDIKKLRRALERDGFTVQDTPGGHTRITHPDKPGIVFGPSTPSDWRALKNMKAQIRRTFDWSE